MAIDFMNVFFPTLIRREDYEQLVFTWNRGDIYRHSEFYTKAMLTLLHSTMI